MLKLVFSFSKIVIATAIVMTLNSCQFGVHSITGSGNVTTETRELSGEFTHIEAEKGLEVVVEQSPTAAVIVEADDNLQSHIITKVENGVLKINSDYNSYLNVKSKKVTVKMPVIEGIETGTGVSLTSGNILKSDEMTIKANSGSSIEIDVESDKVIIESSSGSQITLAEKP